MFLMPRPNKGTIEQMMTVQEFLTYGRVITLYGTMEPMNSTTIWTNAAYIVDALLATDIISDDPIYLLIDSPGGWVITGLLLYDTIKMLRSPIYTIGRNCQSMATLILASGEKGHRYVLPNCRTMLHLPTSEVRAKLDSEDFKRQSQEIEKTKDTLVEILRQNGVKKSAQEILDDIDRSFWMDAQETIEYGLADKIMDAGVWQGMLSNFDGIKKQLLSEEYLNTKKGSMWRLEAER